MSRYMFSGMTNTTRHISKANNIALTLKPENYPKISILSIFWHLKVKVTHVTFERYLVEFLVSENLYIDTKIVQIGEF